VHVHALNTRHVQLQEGYTVDTPATHPAARMSWRCPSVVFALGMEEGISHVLPIRFSPAATEMIVRLVFASTIKRCYRACERSEGMI
jgi:hypothetical protein